MMELILLAIITTSALPLLVSIGLGSLVGKEMITDDEAGIGCCWTIQLGAIAFTAGWLVYRIGWTLLP